MLLVGIFCFQFRWLEEETDAFQYYWYLLYSWLMNTSYNFDKKIGFMIWCNPTQGMKQWFKYWQGRIRLWWGFCPACNSDSPELYTCKICDGYCNSSPHYEWPIRKFTRMLWWCRWGVNFKAYQYIQKNQTDK